MEGENYKIEIPERFYSDSEGKPFENCLICNKYLLKKGTSYIIEKALKTYQEYKFHTTVYEYAICHDCYLKMQQRMSEESKMNLQNYFMNVMNKKSQEPVIMEISEFNLNNWLSKCFIKGSPVSQMKEYQIVAQFEGSKMILSTPPMIIGEEAMNELSALLSEKTIDEMNDFREKFLSPPPDLEEIIYGKKLIMI